MNVLVSTALTVYIVIYPAQWIVDLMEVSLHCSLLSGNYGELKLIKTLHVLTDMVECL